MCDIGLRNSGSTFYQNFVQQDESQLPLDLLAKLAEEVASLKPRFNINGIEPLLHEDIAAAVALLKRHGSKVQIITNGILLEKAAEGLVTSGLDVLRVSLDGPEEVHDRIRGKGVFRRALAGLEAVARAKRDLGLTAPKTIANYTITNLNYGHLLDFAEGLGDSGLVDGIQFKQMYFVTKEMSEEHNRKFGHLGLSTPTNLGVVDLAEIDLDVLWAQYRAIKMLKGPQAEFWPNLPTREIMRIYYRQPEEPINSGMCSTPWRSLHVLPNGDTIIRSRCFLYKTGNLKESSLQEIWRGERYRAFRRELRRNRQFPVCRRCCGSF